MPAGSLCWPLPVSFQEKVTKCKKVNSGASRPGLKPTYYLTSLRLGFIYRMGVILLISELWLVQLKVLTHVKGMGLEQEVPASCLSLESFLI